MHGAVVSPDFKASRVLCSDPWDYVSLWLKRNHKDDASFYWDQAKHFYDAALMLPSLSAPLASYYCFLNAAKALLSSNGLAFIEHHGCTGRSMPGKKSLEKEFVEFHGSGVLPSMCNFLKEPNNASSSFDLKTLLWHIPFIHRSFCLTYTSATELFIPLLDSCFMRKDNSNDTWFQAQISPRYVNSHTKKVIAPGFEVNKFDGRYELRKRARFTWSGRDVENSINNLEDYHRTLRKRIVPIHSSENRWYIKKSVSGYDKIKNSQLTLMYAVMHRLSELSRYEPMSLNKHFEMQHNWLISEFIRIAPRQFIYGMASEITGLEFITPDSY